MQNEKSDSFPKRVEAAEIWPLCSDRYDMERGENHISFFWTSTRTKLAGLSGKGVAAVAFFVGNPVDQRTIHINGQAFTLRAGFCYCLLRIPTPSESLDLQIETDSFDAPGDGRRLGVQLAHVLLLKDDAHLERYISILRSLAHYQIDFPDISFGYSFDRRGVLMDEIAKTLDFSGKNVLDIGSSFGHFHPEIYRQGAATLTAVDYSPQALAVVHAIAAVLGKSDVSTVCMNLDYDSLVKRVSEGAKKAFDIVLLCGVLYHVLSPLKVFLESASLVAEEGTLVLETQVFAQTDEPWAKLGFLGEFDHPEKMKWMLSEAMLRRLLQSQGFEVVHVQCFTWPDMLAVSRENSQRILMIARKKPGIMGLQGFQVDAKGQVATKPAPHW